jgi:hypothetical protein
MKIHSKWLNSKLLSIWNSSGITPKGPLGPWAPKAPLGPGVRRRRTYAPCRDVHRASVDEVCARYDVAENVEANKLGLYMGTGEQKLGSTTYHRSPGQPGPHIRPKDIIFVRTVRFKKFLVGAGWGDIFVQCGLKHNQNNVSMMVSRTLEKEKPPNRRGWLRTVRLKTQDIGPRAWRIMYPTPQMIKKCR